MPSKIKLISTYPQNLQKPAVHTSNLKNISYFDLKLIPKNKESNENFNAFLLMNIVGALPLS
ncbi:MAG: hypothetical protein ACR2FN_07020 [Chitinophagaceae bacterium]